MLSHGQGQQQYQKRVRIQKVSKYVNMSLARASGTIPPPTHQASGISCPDPARHVRSRASGGFSSSTCKPDLARFPARQTSCSDRTGDPPSPHVSYLPSRGRASGAIPLPRIRRFLNYYSPSRESGQVLSPSSTPTHLLSRSRTLPHVRYLPISTASGPIRSRQVPPIVVDLTRQVLSAPCA